MERQKNLISKFAIVGIILGIISVIAVTTPTIKFLSQLKQKNKNPQQEITNLYHQILKREPDAEGLRGWVIQYKRGMPLDQIEKAFYNSPEYKQKEGNY